MAEAGPAIWSCERPDMGQRRLASCGSSKPRRISRRIIAPRSPVAKSGPIFANSPAAAQVMTPTEYVTTAGASDLYERESSQMVLESTQIRAFAQMMVTGHGKSTADVKAAAARSKVKVTPPRLTPTQTEMVALLRAETGAASDAAYRAAEGGAWPGAGGATSLCDGRHRTPAQDGRGGHRPRRHASHRDAQGDAIAQDRSTRPAISRYDGGALNRTSPSSHRLR